MIKIIGIIILNALGLILVVRWFIQKVFKHQVNLSTKPIFIKFKGYGHHPEKQIIRNFYRLYKYVHLQIEVGTRKEEIYKSLYKVVETPILINPLKQMSVIISQSHDVQKGLHFLKKQWKHPECKTFIGLLETMEQGHLNHQTFSRLDHVMFQKYLTYIREETDKIKRHYWMVIVLFTLLIVLALIFPILNQMLYSAKQIFLY